MTPRKTPPNRRTLTLRTEVDVLAFVPYSLGFHPKESLVLVAVDRGGRAFHARIDLPQDPDDLPWVVAQLVDPARRHRARLAMVLAYTPDEQLAEVSVTLLAQELEQAAVRVDLRMRVDAQRWFPLGPGAADPRARAGIPYDLDSHPLTTESVLEGRVTFRNRDELVGSLEVGDPDAVRAVRAEHRALGPLAADDDVVMLAECQWLVDQIDRWSRGAALLAPPEPPVLARLVRAVADRDVRDFVWSQMRREDAERHVRFWREVVRRCPEELAAAPAGLLAFVAWLSGDGALSWCAVERCLRADPAHALGQLVAQALESALPPSTWRPIDRAHLRLAAG